MLAAVLFAPALAQAAKSSGDTVEKVTNLNKKALAAYAKEDYEGARAALREALDLCNSANLDTHPIKARTHIHLGVVSIAGFHQRELGIKHFKKAIEIQPDIKLTKSLSTPELEEAFAEAKGAGGGGGEAAGEGGGEAEPQAGAEGGGAAEPGSEAAASGDEEERPRPRPRPRKRKRTDEEEEGGDEGTGAGQTGKVFLAIQLGSGAGLATGSGELNPMHKLSAAGFALAQAGHVAPEIGYFISPNLLLSAQFRVQFLTGVNEERINGVLQQPSKIGFSAFAKATYLTSGAGMRWFFGGLVGGGNIRHVLLFKADTACGPNADTQCVDSLKSGPFFIGPTAGFLYELGNSANIILAVNSQIGVPKFTINFDLDFGLAFRF